jgi:predicted Rossmann-fold nucleotide-binding protein
MFEMLTWNTLNIHNKKVILLNIAGFYNNLIGHINQMQQSGFLYEDWQKRIGVFETSAQLIAALDEDKS